MDATKMESMVNIMNDRIKIQILISPKTPMMEQKSRGLILKEQMQNISGICAE